MKQPIPPRTGHPPRHDRFARALDVRIAGSLLAGTTLAILLAIVFLPAMLANATAPVPLSLLSEGYSDGATFAHVRPIAPGVVHRFDSFATGPLTLNTVTIDTSRPELVVEAKKGRDDLRRGEALDRLVRRLADPDARPIVAINADFWGTGSIPIGLFIDDGVIWKGAYRDRSVFAFDDLGHFHIGPVDFEAVVRGANEGEVLVIDRITHSFRDEDPSFVTAYTWPHGPETPETKHGQTRVVFELEIPEWLPNAPVAARVREIATNGTTPLDRTTVVLILESAPPAWLAVGAEVLLDARLRDLPGKVIGAVGGLPRLLENGKIVPRQAARREGIRESFVTARHPRTAVGLKADGKTLVFAVVDGRQPGRSIGIDLEDLARWMRDQGCVEAVNLDGGGSSTMVVRDEIVSFPSDASGARSVTNALVVRRKAPIGPPVHLEILPRAATLPPGAKLPLEWRAHDEAHEPVTLAGYSIAWSTDSKEATVSAEGLLDVGKATGALVVRARAVPGGDASPPSADATAPGTLHARTTYPVVAPAAVEVAPARILLESDGEITLRFDARTADNTAFLGDPRLWEVVAPPFLRFVPEQRRLHATGPGEGFLRVRFGARETRVPVAVDRHRQTLAFSFDTLPAENMSEWIEGIRHDASKTSVHLATEERKEGEAAWRFAYGMTGGGTTKVALPLDAELPGSPLAVGFWVKGDGKRHWLRGELTDANDQTYYLDFTRSNPGIDWTDWRFVRTSLDNPPSKGDNRLPMTPPFRVTEIYIVQTTEANKSDGEILVDGLYALSLPASLGIEE